MSTSEKHIPHRWLSSEGVVGIKRPIMSIAYKKGEKVPRIYQHIDLTHQEHNIYDEALKDFHEQRTPEEIAEIWDAFFQEKMNDPEIGEAVTILLNDGEISDREMITRIQQQFTDYIIEKYLDQ